jgi:MFS family permease
VSPARGGERRYRRVLRAPHVKALVAAVLVASLPIGMGTLALVVFIQRTTGSYAAAGLVAAALAAGAAMVMPALGRLIDRVGQAVVLLPCAVVSPLALLTIALAGGDLPVGVLAAVALVAGGSSPPVLTCLRSMWPVLLRGETGLIRTGLTIDALLLEAAFIGGPLTAALLIGAASPQTALVVTAGGTLIGTLAFVAASPMRRTRGPVRSDRRLLGPLRSRGLQTMLLATFPIGLLFGGFDVIAPAIGEEVSGGQSIGGVLIAVTAGGSALGGLWWGLRSTGAPARGYVRAVCLLPLGLAALALPDGLPAMIALALVLGIPFAPFNAAGGELVHRLAPAGMGTESFTWITTALVSGVAAGQGLAGPLVEHAGWRAAALACAGVGVGGAALLLVRRRTLVAPG